MQRRNLKASSARPSQTPLEGRADDASHLTSIRSLFLLHYIRPSGKLLVFPHPARAEAERIFRRICSK
jgi:hypothetical protein